MDKRFFILLVMLFGITSIALGQTKVDQYLKVEVNRKIHIDFGSGAGFTPKDTTILQKLRLLNQLKTAVDVLDYMASLGWTVVNIHAGGLYTATEIIYFKKEFDRSELAD